MFVKSKNKSQVINTEDTILRIIIYLIKFKKKCLSNLLNNSLLKFPNLNYSNTKIKILKFELIKVKY